MHALGYTLVVITPSDVLGFNPLPVPRRALFDALACPFSERGGADAAFGIRGRTGRYGRVEAEEPVRVVEGVLGGFERVVEIAGRDPVQGAVLHYLEFNGGGVDREREDGALVADAVADVLISTLVVGCCDIVVAG